MENSYTIRTIGEIFREMDDEDFYDDENELDMTKEKDKKFSQWLKSGSNQYSAIENSEILNELPSSFYTVHKDQQKGTIYLLSQEVITDEIIEFEDSIHTEIMKLITTYWNSKDDYVKYKVAYKLGILLYGSPGCGKTTIIQLVVKQQSYN